MGRKADRKGEIYRKCMECHTQVEGLPPLDGFHLNPHLCNLCLRKRFPSIMDAVLMQVDWITSEMTVTLKGLNVIAKEIKYDDEAIEKARRAMVYKCHDHVANVCAIKSDPKERGPLDMHVCLPVLQFNRTARKQLKENNKQNLDGFK